MKIAGAATDVKDLTRWNRAGLDRFRYVDGGAAEWVEYLRVAHTLLFARNLSGTSHDAPEEWMKAVETGAFDDGLAIQDALASIQTSWRQPAPWNFAEENADYRTALRAQYDQQPLDQAAQISRAFARAFHILTESLDAYANEGFLATATQATHLRRLLELIDFEPRLAASASVPIALSVLPGTSRQSIQRGLAVEHLPADGSPILTFESMHPLVVDPGLNLLRPSGWDTRLDPIPQTQTEFEIADASVLNIGLNGSMALLSDGAHVQAALVTSANKTDQKIVLDRGLGTFSGTLQGTELLLAPTEVHATRPRGTNWIHFAAAPKAYVGQIVSLSTDPSHSDHLTWNAYAEIVDGVDGAFHSVARSAENPEARARGIIGMTELTEVNAAVQDLQLFGDMVAYVFGDMAVVTEVRGRDIRINRSIPGNLKAVFPAVRSVVVNDASLPEKDQVPILGPYVTPHDAEPLGTLATLKSDRVYIDAPFPEGFKNGAQIAVQLGDGAMAASEISSLQNDRDGFWFAVTLPSGYAPADVTEIGVLFGASSVLVHEVRSDAELFPAEMNGGLRIEIDSTFDDLMVSGRKVLVVPEPETTAPHDIGDGLALTITKATRQGATLRLEFSEDIDQIASLRRGYVVIYANVADFAHGKSLPEKVLGSGDGSISGQVMQLPAADVATREDPSFPGGIAPDIEITASGRKLQLVASAEDADLLQPSYLVRIAEDGSAEAQFLSRLPSEADSVRLTRFRQGSGASGNSVPPLSITKPTPKNPIIDALIQPLAPQLGADVQDASALKTQGNSQFALMDRALSARDFARLAESTTSIWHAHADLVREAGAQGRPTIALTVVPAGGGAVQPVVPGLTDFLLSRTTPGTVLDIRAYRPAPVKGRAVVTLKSGYAQDAAILEEIQANVFAQFNLQARGLGARLFVTKITAAIESHVAVENLIFTLTPNWSAADEAPQVSLSASGAIQAVMPAVDQVVYFREPADIDILWNTGDAS